MFLLLITIFTGGFLLFLYWIHRKWEAEDAQMGIPGPTCLPILGNLLDLKNDFKNDTLHYRLIEYAKQYGDTYRLRFGWELIIFTKDVKIIENIVNNAKFRKGSTYKMYEPWLGDGLLLSFGEKWHKMRKLLTPAFHFQILERFIPIYEDHGKIFIEKIRELGDDKVINVVPWFHAYTLDVISESSMGYKSNAQNDPQSKFVVANRDLLDILVQRFYYPLYKIEWIWKLTSLHNREKNLIDYIHNFVDEIIENRRDYLLSESAENLSQKRPALLDILLQSTIDGKSLSNDEIRAEVNNFMLAGHETTGTTLGFLTYILAKHPDVQSRVFNEIKANGLDVPDKSLTIREINSLSYFETVIKETLRLYPILAGALKECPEDIRIGKTFIPANTTICTAIRSSHYTEKSFKNPDVFDPSRWEDEVTMAERNPYAYQPFSAGLRNCIGQKFALLEMKCLMIEILREYEVVLGSPDFEVTLRYGTLCYAKDGIMVKFRQRNK